MQIKTTIWHHLTSTRMAEMWGLTIPVVSEDVEESELSSLLVGMQNGAITLEKGFVVS